MATCHYYLDIKSHLHWLTAESTNHFKRLLSLNHHLRRRAYHRCHSLVNLVPPLSLLEPFQPTELHINIKWDFICIFIEKKNQIPNILTFLRHCQSNRLAFTTHCFYGCEQTSWVWSELTRNDAQYDVVSQVKTTSPPQLFHLTAYLGIC